MFGKKKPLPRLSIDKFSSLVSDSLSVVGDVEFEGGLKVSGRIKGRVSYKPGTASLLALCTNGYIEGDVSSHDALIDGRIVGDLVVENLLELHSNARVLGSISYRQLRMESGAVVEGVLRRLDDEGPLLEITHQGPEQEEGDLPEDVLAVEQSV